MRTTATGNRATRYVCNGVKGTGPNHISRNVDKADAIVTERAVYLLSGIIEMSQYAEQLTGATKLDPAWSDLTTELAAIEARRKDINEDYADGYFDRVKFRAQIDRLKTREVAVRSKMDAGPRVPLRIFFDVESRDDVLAK